MNTDRLRSDLADLAEEATPVDLRDRTLRTSRRLGIQRAVATSAAALVLLGAATGTAFALTNRDNAGPAPAATTSATVDPTPSATSEPIPTPSATTSANRTTAPSGADIRPAARIGLVFYGAGPVTTTAPGPAPLYSWTPGKQPGRLLTLPWITVQTNAAISPDGRKVAWVDDQSALNVASVDGSGQRKLYDTVDGQCWGPTWSPDSRRLTVSVITSTNPYQDRKGIIDVSTGAFSPVAAFAGCHPVWARGTDRMAAPDGSTGQVYLFDSDGGNRRAIPSLGAGARDSSSDIASISPDGSRIALLRRGPGQNAGDVARELSVNVVLDTRTGVAVALPLGGRQLLQAVFQSDGSLLARVKGTSGNVLVLIAATGRRLSESPEPAALATMQILSVTG